MIITEPYTYNTFHGGVTDYYLNGPFEKCKTADNLNIVPYGPIAKLKSRPGSTFFDPTDPQIPPGNQRIGTLIYFEGTLFAHSSRKIYYSDGVWNELTGPTSNGLFPSSVDVNSVVSTSLWNNHLILTSDAYTKPHKIYKDDSSTLQLRTAGLPYPASTFTITGGTGATTNNYLYAILYEYTYKVGTVTFKDYGPPEYKQFTSTYDTTRTLGSLGTLANGTDDNYDTATIKIGIYRSINNGKELYKVGEVTNGTTTFNDTVTDAVLIANETLYTTGGVPDNEPPPECKLVHVVGGAGYYACIKEGTEYLNNRVRQSFVDDIDSVPSTFYADVDDDIIGMSSAKGVVVLACDSSAWRLDGVFDELGRGGMIPRKISDTASCVSSASMVQTFDGVFWAGKDGFYYSDGYATLKINEDQDRSYASFVDTAEKMRRIVGRYDPIRRVIYWTLQGSGATDCNKIAVLNLNYGITKNSPFTYWSDDGLDNFSPSAITLIGDDLVRADRRGYVFKHSESLYSDLNIDLTATPSDWYTVPVRYAYESCQTNFGTDFYRKWVTWINMQCKNETDLALQIVSNNDDGRLIKNLKEINFDANMVWGDESEVWGKSSAIWNYQGYIEEMRRFPAGSLRCYYKGVRFENAYVNILNSDSLGLLSVNSTTKTAVLSGASMEWPGGLLGYYISFANNYDLQYRITAVSTDTITFEDTANTSIDLTDTAWYVRGYPKDQVFYLISYTVHFAALGKTQDKYQVGESNTNA